MSIVARLQHSAEPVFARRDAARVVASTRREPGATGLPIELRGLSRTFGDRAVLAHLDTTIPAGQAVAIVGRSGGGKSTLLRLMTGLDRPTTGMVTMGGVPVDGPQRAARLMFQEARLLPWQSVIGNVGIARGPEWRAKAMAALETVGLADRAAEWPSALSGGQRQRVALARALVDSPGVVLLDEPFGALDALTRAEMHELLGRLWRERGFTLVLITHDVGEALALTDRVLVLRNGTIALDVPVDRGAPVHESLTMKADILAAL